MKTVLGASVALSFIGFTYFINGYAEPLEIYAATILGALTRAIA